MRRLHCQFCVDYRKFKLKLSTAQNIDLRLKEIIRVNNFDGKLDMIEKGKINQLLIPMHVRMMCGNCTQANQQGYQNVILSIKESIYLIIKKFDDLENYNDLKYKVQSLLRGNYPELAYYFQRETDKKISFKKSKND